MPVVVTGDAGLGKSTFMLHWLRWHAYYSRKLFNGTCRYDPDKSLYYMRSPGARADLLNLHKDERGFNEGYFSGMNKESMNREVVALEKTVNAVRDGCNLLIWNFSLMQRATRPIIERALVWIHKPNREKAILYMRSREFITNDVWGIKDILAAKPYEIDYYLKYNPNRITTMNCYKLPPRVEREYLKRKKLAHATEAERQHGEAVAQEVDMAVLKIVAEDVKAQRVDFAHFTAYLQSRFNLGRREAKLYEREYFKFATRNRIAGQLHISTEGSVQLG